MDKISRRDVSVIKYNFIVSAFIFPIFNRIDKISVISAKICERNLRKSA